MSWGEGTRWRRQKGNGKERERNGEAKARAKQNGEQTALGSWEGEREQMNGK